MRKAFVSLIAILALAVSALAADLPSARHVADTGSAYELTLATSASSIVTAPFTLNAVDLRMCRPALMLSVDIQAGQRAIDRDIYATKIRHVIANRPRAVTRVWRC